MGGYFSQHLPLRDLSWFSQVLYQGALDEREGYKPGARFGLDLGLRHDTTERLGLMLQLNYLHRGKDSGREADQPDDTGGDFLYLSPGASLNLTKALQLYGFVQLPIYQEVNGVQITAEYAVVVGLSVRF